ncbi:MAG: thioredoxin [Clostridia bacterium]|jgi:hypothetical protein|nr:thioredoxin [Clostridia bacterium]MBR3487108.1 thioredoxin [Clostridia bacterium]
MKTNKFTRYFVPVLLVLIGAGCIVYGVTDGEAGAVLRKAISICMECIGIG